MRKTILLLCILLTVVTVFSQQKIKKGFGFGALPAISFDSDLGFQYGALVNLFQYGDGSRFPKYDHSLYLEYSTYTKGTSIARLRYDSERLIPKVRTTIDVAYVTDLMSDFYGFNGYQSIYDTTRIKTLNKIFYKNERNMFRAKADFQGAILESDFGWIAGFAFYNFAIDTVNISKLNLSSVPGGSLYQRYLSAGLISSDEAKGGSINYFKTGLKYDTRDQLACPMKGIWTEAVIQTAPRFANKFPHTKLSVVHRQYFTLAKDLSFAYRLDYQMTLGNDPVPYFAQPLLITSFLTAATNQGMGGKTSIRGVLRNRVVGDAVGFGNFEFRYKFLRFEWLKQNFYLGTNVFFDSGIIIKPIDITNQLSALTDDQKNDLKIGEYQAGKFHSAAGIGLKIGWNENFVISADFGKAFNKQDGNTGMYIALNYLF